MTYANPYAPAAITANFGTLRSSSSATGEDSNNVQIAYNEFLKEYFMRNAISPSSNLEHKTNIMSLWFRDTNPEKKSSSFFMVTPEDIKWINERLISIESELRKIDTVNEHLQQRLHEQQTYIIRLSLLPNKGIIDPPLDAIIEPDGESFIARATDIPLYGVGDDPMDAIEALKMEIENLYDDLAKDDDFTTEWLHVKMLLSERLSHP